MALTHIQQRIAEYELKYYRSPGSVRLLAVSKSQSIDKIQTICDSGQHAFGENYLQEALNKQLILPQDIEWHFIGSVQRNKTRKIAEHFSWVQTISDPQVAKRLHEQRPSHLPPLNICLQVNVNHEATKSGVLDMTALLQLAEYCMALPKLRLRGLMSIPALTKDFDQQREVFHYLRQIFEELRHHFSEDKDQLDTLSMGMSNDMEAAIAEGSTMVRIGASLFGGR